MTASLIAPAAQICAFALGCTLIHAARAHAAAVTRLLAGAAMVAAALVLITATAVYAPDDQARFDEVTVYAAPLDPSGHEGTAFDRRSLAEELTMSSMPNLARLSTTALVLVSSIALSIRLVQACGGFVEAPIACDDPSPNGFASWMLKRVSKAIEADRPKAFAAFTTGTDGFRTADTYVFCVGPDGVMNAHPNPILRDHDVRDLHDKTGNYFIKTMLAEAKPGQISVIRYLFPKPGSTVEEPKTTYYTRAGDQMCGVGVYDADAGAPKQATPEARVASLRAKLDRQIPASARGDWTAFLEALNQAGDAQAAAVVRARDSLKAAEDALAPETLSVSGE